MQPVPLPAHYFTAAGGGGDAAAAVDAQQQMHPAVLQHLLQQQQMQQQLALIQLQAAQQGGLPGAYGGFSAASGAPLAPPPPLFAGAPLMQTPSSLAPSGRSDSASTSTSSAENTQPSSPPSTSSDNPDHVRLHISNIPYKWRDPDLRKMFGEHGEVVEAEVIFNERGSKGFGFITMATKEGADAAKKAINGKEFERRIVEVNAATMKLNGKQKARVLQAQHGATVLPLQHNPHLQLAMLQQHQLQPPVMPAADPQQMALQQLIAAQTVLAQYAAQQQLLQGIQPTALLQQQQPQQWMQLQQLGGAAAAPALDLEKLAKQQRYRPY